MKWITGMTASAVLGQLLLIHSVTPVSHRAAASIVGHCPCIYNAPPHANCPNVTYYCVFGSQPDDSCNYCDGVDMNDEAMCQLGGTVSSCSTKLTEGGQDACGPLHTGKCQGDVGIDTPLTCWYDMSWDGHTNCPQHEYTNVTLCP
jgi:hypothetical protein